ncbi:hypothetical protein [Nocardia brasiliensis]|uniref:hypothetical protein n=1 Tax=Nocardia brasiliensis TaxID=37326 RepID=UPI0033DDF131
MPTIAVSGQTLSALRRISGTAPDPRASILFDDRAGHTLDEIRRAATEFQVGQGLRILAAALTALFAVVAALVCYRARIRATVSASSVDHVVGVPGTG